jgi:hypothetical protein
MQFVVKGYTQHEKQSKTLGLLSSGMKGRNVEFFLHISTLDDEDTTLPPRNVGNRHNVTSKTNGILSYTVVRISGILSYTAVRTSGILRDPQLYRCQKLRDPQLHRCQQLRDPQLYRCQNLNTRKQKLMSDTEFKPRTRSASCRK